MTSDSDSSLPEDPLTPAADGVLDVGSAEPTSPPPVPEAAAAYLAGAGGGGEGAPAPEAGAPGDVEGLIVDLERSSRERDEFLEALRRTQADFENYRKRVMKQQADDVARAAESLVEKLLPVLDACDGAVRHGSVEVEPVFAALLGALEKEGLGRIDPLGQVFDPNLHDAVMHEPAGDGEDATVVSDVMRPGYSWKGRIIRPAMVKVRG